MLSAIPTLATDRLTLRAFTSDDAPTVQVLASAAEVAATTFNLPHPYPDGAAASWIRGHAEAAGEGRAYTWAIVRTADARVLGALRLLVDQVHARGELGYWLGLPYWNQGYMTEAVRCVLVFGFGDLRLHRIAAGCFPRNRASSRVMEKAGLRYEGVLRGYVRKGETFEDVALFAMLVEDGDGKTR